MRKEQAGHRATVDKQIEAHIRKGGKEQDEVVVRARRTVEDLCASLEELIQGVVLWKVLFFDIGACSVRHILIDQPPDMDAVQPKHPTPFSFGCPKTLLDRRTTRARRS